MEREKSTPDDGEGRGGEAVRSLLVPAPQRRGGKQPQAPTLAGASVSGSGWTSGTWPASSRSVPAHREVEGSRCRAAFLPRPSEYRYLEHGPSGHRLPPPSFPPSLPLDRAYCLSTPQILNPHCDVEIACLLAYVVSRSIHSFIHSVTKTHGVWYVPALHCESLPLEAETRPRGGKGKKVLGEGSFHSGFQPAFSWGLASSRYVFTQNSLIIFLLTVSEFLSGRPPHP